MSKNELKELGILTAIGLGVGLAINGTITYINILSKVGLKGNNKVLVEVTESGNMKVTKVN